MRGTILWYKYSVIAVLNAVWGVKAVDENERKAIFDRELPVSLLGRLAEEDPACKRLSFTPGELQYLKDTICRAINKPVDQKVYEIEEDDGRLMLYYKNEETAWHALDDFPDEDETITYYRLVTVEKLTRDGVRHALNKVRKSCDADSFKPDDSWTEWIKLLREKAMLTEAYSCFFETRAERRKGCSSTTRRRRYTAALRKAELCASSCTGMTAQSDVSRALREFCAKS